MSGKRRVKPKCIIIAGPNGAGKTTFARSYLLAEAKIDTFINADLIASGLSPLNPERASRAAGRILLEELERITSAGGSFALESTLSGLTYIGSIKTWRSRGYRIEILFLRLDSPKISLHRIATRVAQGGHDVPKQDVLRRFERGWNNFQERYCSLADRWWVYDASGDSPVLLDHK